MIRTWTGPDCPLPADIGDHVQMAHGGGGRTMRRLIEGLIRPAFDNDYLSRDHDGAVFEITGPSAFTTDSYVVRPLFFPGGDIGTLAVFGTVNDLAMCGARPRYMSLGLILEEGLSMDVLRRVVTSAAKAARQAGTLIVTGDIKVVDKGKADGMFVNTAGVGEVVAPSLIGPAAVRPGDAVILSGDIARHGMAVMAAREDLSLQSRIDSDCAPLHDPVLALLDEGVGLHCLRDLTRGGLAAALVEIAEMGELSILVEEKAIPVREDVRAACEILGLDPLYVANEGRFIAFVPEDEAERALSVLRRFDVSGAAQIIGRVDDGAAGRVTVRGLLGAPRALDMLSGEQLPRIC